MTRLDALAVSSYSRHSAQLLVFIHLPGAVYLLLCGLKPRLLENCYTPGSVHPSSCFPHALSVAFCDFLLLHLAKPPVLDSINIDASAAGCRTHERRPYFVSLRIEGNPVLLHFSQVLRQGVG